MNNTFSVNGEPWGMLHQRVHDHPGVIVDLGCLMWDWSRRFIGKREVIGADPFEPNEPEGAKLHRACVGPFSGVVCIQNHGLASSCVESMGNLSPMKMWREIVPVGNTVAALKINIEGGEWPLLASWPDEYFVDIDQIAISFHEHRWPGMAGQTEVTLARLRRWYDCESIFTPFGWWLCVKRI